MSVEGTANDAPWTITRLLAWTRDYFERNGVPDPRLAAEILLARSLGCRRIELYTRFEQVPAPAELDRYRALIKDAARHVPIAYLVGTKEFYSLEFEITPAVMIPRPETEILVERLIDCARSQTGAERKSEGDSKAEGEGEAEGKRDGEADSEGRGDSEAGSEFVFLDMATGSGCIAIAALKNLPNARAVASDISPEALAVARRNAERHGVTDRVRFVEADRLALPPDARPEAGFHAIVSNPPYIALDEMPHIDRSVREYEPRVALTDEGDGLSFYRTLAEDGPPLLRPGGAILVEVADNASDAVRTIFDAANCFEHITTWRDTTGPHDRVMHFQLRTE